MAQLISTLETSHTGVIHDAQLDYYGKRLATASSDHSIRIWDVSSESTPSFLSELRGHDGPVWQVSWGHPKFGNLLASSSYDKLAIIWLESRQNEWVIAYTYDRHAASVNSVSWAPWSLGLHLATASSDGTVSVLSLQPQTNSTWTFKAFQAHANGVNAVSWASPPAQLSSTANATSAQHSARSAVSTGATPSLANTTPKLVTGGSDNQVRIWRLDEASGEWLELQRLLDKPHTNWVRDVSWRPNVGVPSNTIASCGDDEKVILWDQEDDGLPWTHAQTLFLGAPVWRVSWSVTGTVLAVASGEDKVSLFKESLDGMWERVTELAGSEGSSGSSGRLPSGIIDSNAVGNSSNPNPNSQASGSLVAA